MWQDEEGALSWEWVMITTLLVIGIVTGVSAARDAAIDEMGDIAQGFVAIDQSYSIDFPLEISIDGDSLEGATDSGFEDDAVYADCGRTSTPLGQGAEEDNF
jgi:Flp pilus assembly pilin Flp